MLTGILVMESLKPGSELDASDLTFTTFLCVEIAEPAPWQPAQWVLGEFNSTTTEPDDLADRLSSVLNEPGWYTDFHDDADHWVVFPRKTFRYRRDDPAGREPAVQHGLSLGVPLEQLDWED